MANTKISALPAVATPAATDQFAVNQGGVSKKMTLQQINGASGGFNPEGTSRIQVNSTTQIQLNVGVIPLLVNSIWQTRAVTAAVTVSNGGLAANTTYFVYAFDSAGTLTLEIVATAHTTDATYGVEIKSGNATRTLVGMVRTNASSQFQNDTENRLIISWFSRRLTAAVALGNAGNSTTSATFAELSGAHRPKFLIWSGGAAVMIYGTGGVNISAGAQTGVISIGFDGTTPEGLGVRFINMAASTQYGGVGISYSKADLAEGFHDARWLGKVTGGATLALDTGGAVGDQSALTVQFEG